MWCLCQYCHCTVQFVSVTSPVSLSLSAALSLYSNECVSETDFNISYSQASPDSTVSELARHWGLWFGSWQRHATVLCYKRCRLGLVTSSVYWGCFSLYYCIPEYKIHALHNEVPRLCMCRAKPQFPVYLREVLLN